MIELHTTVKDHVIAFLIGLDHAPSVSLRILAGQLERRGDRHVYVHEVQLGGYPRALGQQLDEIIGLVDEAGVDQLAIRCTLFNAAVARELVQRLSATWPALDVALWGAEAMNVVRQLPDDSAVRVMSDPVQGLGAEGPAEFHRERMDELVQAARRFRTALTVERLAGPPLPLHQQRGNRMPPDADALPLDRALAWASPLLRSGLALQIREPALTARRDVLEALLAKVGSGRLWLEVPAELLDRSLVQQLIEAGVQRLDLDLSRELPTGLLSLVQSLAEANVQIRGRLLCGVPGTDHGTVVRQVDCCLRGGIEELTLARLAVPPGSPLRGEPHLVLDPGPPYHVLAHTQATPAEILRGVRLGATLELLRDSLVGTGVLRALAHSAHSVGELLEGFGESLAVQGRGLPWGEPPPAVERLFAEYLRLHHGIDLGAAQRQLRLVRSPGVCLRWVGDGSRLVTDETTGREANLGRTALALIDHCETAQTVHELCEQLVVDAPLHRRSRLRRELRITVDKLATMGFLVPHARDQGPSSEAPFVGLEEFDYHCRMLMDTRRVDAYRDAIRQVVRPGDHVVEIGTGTGILAVLAAQQGAHVTAIERYAVVEMAREVARRNGVSEQIRFIRGRSDLVQVEPPADVLVTELVGNRILNEGLLEVTLDARQRLLRPDARFLPRRIEILAQLGYTDRFEQLHRELQVAGGRYEVELGPMADWIIATQLAGNLGWELGRDEERLSPLSDEVTVTRIDLALLEGAELTVPFSVSPTQDGMVNAVALSFRLELTSDIVLTSQGTRHGLHWNKPVVMLAHPVEVCRQRALALRLGYELGGDLKVEVT